MKIEQLLECSAEQLQAMTDAELLKHFEPYLNVTRPEFAPRPQAASNKPTAIAATPQFQAKLKQLQALGIDINSNDFQKRKGKK
jgi:hypothetical protein